MLSGEQRKGWENGIEIAGLIFSAAGVLITVLSLRWGFLLETGVGVVAVGLGLMGMAIAKKSDVKMAALANLEFDEKAVAMEGYRDLLSYTASYAQTDFIQLKSDYGRLIWDLRAMTHVAEWADRKTRTEARERLDRITDLLAEHVRKGDAMPDWLDLDEVKKLSNKIWPR